MPAFKLDPSSSRPANGWVDVREQFSERKERDWKAHWWFPAGIGFLALGGAIAVGMNRPPSNPTPLDAALSTLGLTLVMLDAFGSGRVISTATIRGPQERANEASARFYAWCRARRRYGIAAALSAMSAIGVAIFKTGNLNFFAFMSGLALYLPVWALDLYRSLQEANKLFPPE